MKLNNHVVPEIFSITPLYGTYEEHGEAKISRIEVTEDAAMWDNLRYIRDGNSIFCVDAGHYTRLVVGSELMMSDTPMERRTNRHFVQQATGHVFIAGLGLGLVIQALLNKEEVTKITVLEKSKDVIHLVAPKFQSNKLEIIEGDIFEWLPSKGQTFDTIYFDIWATLDQDLIKSEMNPLVRKFRKYLSKKDGFINCWMVDYLRKEKIKDRNNARGRYWNW